MCAMKRRALKTVLSDHGGEDGICSVPCGRGTVWMTRDVMKEGSYGGKPCPSTRDYQNCNDFPCPPRCEYTAWNDIRGCNAQCGTAFKIEARVVNCVGCDNTTSITDICGPAMRTSQCDTQPCAVDCIYDEWGIWGVCNQPCGPGTMTRARGVLVNASNGGKPCSESSQEEKPCQRAVCSAECKWTQWKPIGGCSAECGGGLQNLTRMLIVDPPVAEPNAVCPGARTSAQLCNSDPCPVDCKVADWTNGTCDRDCGGGSRTDIRRVIVQAVGSGEPCPANLSRVNACNEQVCPAICNYGEWSVKVACNASCGPGMQMEERPVKCSNCQPPVTSVTQDCSFTTRSTNCSVKPCPIDCQLSDYGDWSDCSASCGPGLRKRSRTIQVTPQYSGVQCGALDDNEVCYLEDCPANCSVTPYSASGPCSAECAGGSQVFVRTVSSLNMSQCSNISTREMRTCNSEPCPGAMRSWSVDAFN